MSALALAVLITAGLASLALLFYVRVRLPAVMDERFGNTMRAFSTGIELRVSGDRGLSDRVVPLCAVVARRLKLSRERVRDLEMAARLRDIGLCAIPYHLLNAKARWEWTEADRATYDRHPEISAAMLELVPSLRHLAPIVRLHHTYYDGSNGTVFPSGTDIPIAARILSVVIDFAWLDRHQGRLLAVEELRNGAGVQYDPLVVDAVLDVIRSTRAADARVHAKV